MNLSSLTYSLENRIAIVTLNRPEHRNALDDAMIRDLHEVFSFVNRETLCRVVVLEGAGQSFCAGMDMRYLQRCSQLSQEENVEDARNLLKVLQLISALRKPVVAMVSGAALGGGCGIAAACDFVFAAKREAKFGVPEVRRGFVPAVILSYLIRRMGLAAAKEFVLRGEILDAVTAQRRGIVTEVVDDDALRQKVMEFVTGLSRDASPSSIALTKDLFTRMDEMSASDAAEYAANLNAMARKTDDFQKGILSFFSKEKLEW